MLDTLIFRVHGINELKGNLKDMMSDVLSGETGDKYLLPHHNQLLQNMLEYEGKLHSLKGTWGKVTTSVEETEPHDFIRHETEKYVYKHKYDRDEIVMVDEKKVKTYLKSATGAYRVPSSYKDVTFRINDTAGYIDLHSNSSSQ